MPNDIFSEKSGKKDVNIFKDSFVTSKKEEPVENKVVIHQSDFKKRAIKQQFIDGEVLQMGLASDRPNGLTHTKMYFSTDTSVLSIWDGTVWRTVTLT